MINALCEQRAFYRDISVVEPMMNSSIGQAAIAPLQQGLIVSCQAPAQSPLHDPQIIAAIAQTSVMNGAVGVRIDSPDHIRAVRDRLDANPKSNIQHPKSADPIHAVHDRLNAPIIGLWKQQFPDSDVYITPQFRHARAIAQAGADIIAIDGTPRRRPGDESLATLVQQIHRKLGKPVMADVDTLESAIAAADAGADIIGTTLYGYTAATQHCKPPGLDLLKEMANSLTVYLICEGGITSPKMARQALDMGAYAVVVGTAITGIDLQVQAYVQTLS